MKTMKMDDVKKTVLEKFTSVGLDNTLPGEDFYRFQNDFAVYFVFFMASSEQLEKTWKKKHEILIEDYTKFEGPRDLEWNYYSIFILADDCVSHTDLGELRLQIESDRSYSRKYVLAPDELDQVPPAMITRADLSEKVSELSDPTEIWRRELGTELFDLIWEGSKKSIPDRLEELVEGSKTE